MRTIPTFTGLLALSLLAPGVLLAWSLSGSVATIGQEAASAVSEILLSSDRERLAHQAQAEAARIDAFLAPIQADVESLRQAWQSLPLRVDPALEVYRDSGLPGLPGFGRVEEALGAYADFDRLGRASPWLPRPALARARSDKAFRARVASELAHAVALSPMLSSVRDRRPDVDLAWVVLASGASNVQPAYDYTTIVANSPEVLDLDEAQQSYVRLVGPEANPAREVRWLAPYLDPFKGLWMSSCAAPIYDGDTFVGSIGVDVLLPSITEAVLEAGVGREGYTFLADTSGRLVAVPERGIRDLVWDEAHRAALLETSKPPEEQHLSPEARAALRDIGLSGAPDAELRALAADLAAGDSPPRETVLQGRRAFVAISRVPRAGWSVAVVQPVDELSAAYAPVRARLEAGQDELTAQLRIFYIVALVMGAALSAGLFGAVVKPLLSLAGRVEGLSWANLTFEARSPSVREVRLLERKIAELLDLIRSARDAARAEHEATAEANRRLSAANEALRLESAERERIETEMARLDKLSTVQVLAAGIAHDFNNLLAAIRVSLSLAELADADGESVAPHLQRAERSVGRAHALTTQLLTFTTGGLPVRQVEAIGPILRDAAIFALRGAACSVETDIDPALPNVEVDAGQIAQVVQNLVLNAVQAMPDGGVVRIRAGRAPGGAAAGAVEIEVEDSGVGIPPEHLAKVFDPFFTTRAGGTGLGLAVCHSIVQKHRGAIRVRSVVGKGTSFTVTLPATDKPLPGMAEAKAVRDGGGRVLAMDDDPALLESLGLLLRKLGYEPVLVADGDAAVVAVQAEGSWEAVILDLTVPGGRGGVEALDEIRRVLPDTPIFVSSGYHNSPVAADPQRHGFDGSIPKPYSAAQLGRALAAGGRARVARSAGDGP